MCPATPRCRYTGPVARSPYSQVSYRIGPGPLTPAVKALVIANVAVFVVSLVVPMMTAYFGLTPAAVVEGLWVWQPLTYMFMHASLMHLLLNMLMLWMFGTEIERLWGTEAFAKFYLYCGLGAAVTTVAAALLPFGYAPFMYITPTVGASGAIYGVLLAYGLTFPDRPIYMYLLFPVPAKYFVMITGAITLLLSINAGGGRVAHLAHLGGLVTGWLLLNIGRGGFSAELKYRYTKWRMNRARRKFGVHQGGRGGNGGGWNVH
jgi:membrane associated rhomboid family serine protease